MLAARPRAPQTRPTWLVLVAAVMLMSAIRLGLSGLYTLRGEDVSAPEVPALVVSVEDAAAKTVALAMARVWQGHGALVRGHAVLQLLVALFIFYVVAAVFSLDPRGRRLALSAGWTGVLYHLGNAVFGLLVLRPEIMAVAPGVVAQVTAGEGGGLDVLLPTLAALSWALPVVTAAFGILFSGLVLAFFGGRRGRVLYGLEPGAPEGSSA